MWDSIVGDIFKSTSTATLVVVRRLDQARQDRQLTAHGFLQGSVPQKAGNIISDQVQVGLNHDVVEFLRDERKSINVMSRGDINERCTPTVAAMWSVRHHNNGIYQMNSGQERCRRFDWGIDGGTVATKQKARSSKMHVVLTKIERGRHVGERSVEKIDAGLAANSGFYEVR